MAVVSFGCIPALMDVLPSEGLGVKELMCQRQRFCCSGTAKRRRLRPCVLRDNLLTYWRLNFEDRSLLASTLPVDGRPDAEARGHARFWPTSDARGRMPFRRDRVSDEISVFWLLRSPARTLGQ